jgi:hypothetical protein
VQKVSLSLSSPYSNSTVLGAAHNPSSFSNIGDLPLAEVQQRLELAWKNCDWEGATTLLEQVVAASPENEAS